MVARWGGDVSGAKKFWLLRDSARSMYFYGSLVQIHCNSPPLITKKNCMIYNVKFFFLPLY
jgi:hypothetical protein